MALAISSSEDEHEKVNDGLRLKTQKALSRNIFSVSRYLAEVNLFECLVSNKVTALASCNTSLSTGKDLNYFLTGDFNGWEN